jgi:hypothetical protein
MTILDEQAPATGAPTGLDDALRRATVDREFRAALMTAPRHTLRGIGIDLPDWVVVHPVENARTEFVLGVPALATDAAPPAPVPSAPVAAPSGPAGFLDEIFTFSARPARRRGGAVRTDAADARRRPGRHRPSAVAV